MILIRHPVWLVALLLVTTACSPPPADEQQILDRLEEMTEALAARDARGALAPLAEDFSGETWNLDQRGMRLILQRELRASDRLSARLFDIDVELHGNERASATFQAVLTGGSGLLPERGRWFQVQTGWRRDDGDWMIISASWEDVIGR